MGFSVRILILVGQDRFRTIRDSTPVVLDILATEYVLGCLGRSGKYLQGHHHRSSRGLLKASQVQSGRLQKPTMALLFEPEITGTHGHVTHGTCQG